MTAMKCLIVLGGAIVAALAAAAPSPGRAQDLRGEIEAIVKDYLTSHPDEVGAIAREYFVKHPEAVGEILAELLKHRAATSASAGGAPAANVKPAVDRSAAVATNAASLFNSQHQVTLGNPQGNVTLVEFFDYSCGYCKRALPDMLSLLKDDGNLKVVLKEFPILGPGSVEAARVAIAARMQDPDGQKYLAFHKELLGNPGPASAEKAFAVAKDQGFDIARLEQDMKSDEVAKTLSENAKLAGTLGITGTPGYVIGADVVVGAIGIAGLQQHIEAARSQGVK
jgi:protein-disulfide isomerase